MASSSAACITCPPGRDRIPRRPAVCDGCRAWLAAMVHELPGLAAELMVRGPYPDDDPRDALALAMPAASIASQRGDRVTGSRERPGLLPANVIDLTAGPRYATVHDLPPPHGDQVGEPSMITVLDEWARWLILHRAKCEHLPTPTVPDLCAWFEPRLDEACDDLEEIGNLADEVRHLRTAARAQLGLTGPDVDLKLGVACPKCDFVSTLYQRAGSDRVECTACPMLLTDDEYGRWVRLSAVGLVHLRGVPCPRCGYEQLYRAGRYGEPQCGWCGSQALPLAA